LIESLYPVRGAVIETKKWRPERNFRRALQKAEIAYLLSFGPEYLETPGDLAESSVRWVSGFVASVVVGESTRRRKLRADMLASRSGATAQERFGLLSCRRLPGRLNTSETAVLLGFQEHDIAALIAAKLLVPLGKPAPNSPKYFAAVEIGERASNTEWLSSATKVIAKHWRRKNQRKQLGVPCCP
jgi:hypothetical protein